MTRRTKTKRRGKHDDRRIAGAMGLATVFLAILITTLLTVGTVGAALGVGMGGFVAGFENVTWDQDNEGSAVIAPVLGENPACEQAPQLVASLPGTTNIVGDIEFYKDLPLPEGAFGDANMTRINIVSSDTDIDVEDLDLRMSALNAEELNLGHLGEGEVHIQEHSVEEETDLANASYADAEDVTVGDAEFDIEIEEGAGVNIVHGAAAAHSLTFGELELPEVDLFITMGTPVDFENPAPRVIQPEDRTCDALATASNPDQYDPDADFNVLNFETEDGSILGHVTVENVDDEAGSSTIYMSEDEAGVVASTTESLEAGANDTFTLTWGDAGPGSYSLTATTDTDDVGMDSTHELQGFDLEITSTNSPVLEGEVIEVTVSHDSYSAEAEDLHLDIDGTTEDSQEISASGDTTLTWDTTGHGTGSFDAEVYTDGVGDNYPDSDSTTVNVDSEDADPAFFSVTITDTNEPVTEGETLTVTAQVENTGEETDTQDIRLNLDGGVGEVDRHENLELGGGQTDTVTLDWENSDAGTYDATASSDDDNDTQTVTIDEEEADPAEYEVTITDTNEPVEEGERLDVTAEIENVGDEDGDEDVTLEIDGAEEDREENFVVAGGETEILTLSWDTEDGDAGDYTATVTAVDSGNSDSQMVTIDDSEEETEFFSVTITGTNSPVTEGEALDVTAEIENTGDAEGTQTVTLEVPDGTERDSEELTIPADDTETHTFTWETEEGDADTYDAYVHSDDDSDSQEVTVEEEDEDAFFSVTITGTNSPVTEGEDLDVTAEIENTGDLEGTQTVTLEVPDGTERDSEEMTVAGGDTQTHTFTWNTEESDAGTYDAYVHSDDDSDFEEVTVEEEEEADPAFTTLTAEGDTGGGPGDQPFEDLDWEWATEDWDYTEGDIRFELYHEDTATLVHEEWYSADGADTWEEGTEWGDGELDETDTITLTAELPDGGAEECWTITGLIDDTFDGDVVTLPGGGGDHEWEEC